MTSFVQINHNTGAMHIVSINDFGRWHSYSTRRQDFKVHNMLSDFQKYFGCSDEEITMVKLKHGEPVPYYPTRNR